MTCDGWLALRASRDPFFIGKQFNVLRVMGFERVGLILSERFHDRDSLGFDSGGSLAVFFTIPIRSGGDLRFREIFGAVKILPGLRCAHIVEP